MIIENSENIKPIITIEPVTTILEEGKFLRILTELPDIEEEKIRIDLENHPTLITILASDTTKKFTKEIALPYEIRFSKKRFSNGVLEIILEKIITLPP